MFYRLAANSNRSSPGAAAAAAAPAPSADPHIEAGDWSVSNTEVEVLDLTELAGANKFACVLHGVFTEAECQAMIDRSEAEPDGYSAALINSGGGKQQKMLDIRNNDRCIIDDADHAEFMYQRVMQTMRHHDHQHGETRSRGAAEAEDGKENRAQASGKQKGKSTWTKAFVGDPRTTHDSSLFEKFQSPPWQTSKPYYAVGLNERLRFLRYDDGTYFAPHFDGQYTRLEPGERQYERSYVTFQLYLNDGFEGGATRFMNGYDESIGIDVVPRTGSVLLFEHALLHEGSLLVEGRKYALRTDVMYSAHKGQEYAVKPVVVSDKIKEPKPADHHLHREQADEQAPTRAVAENEKMGADKRRSVLETLRSFMSSERAPVPPSDHKAHFDREEVAKSNAKPERGGFGDPYMGR